MEKQKEVLKECESYRKLIIGLAQKSLGAIFTNLPPEKIPLNQFITFLKIQARNLERGGGVGDLPCPFLKIAKYALILGKNIPDCIHFCVKFSILNVVLRVSRRKNFKMFPYGAFSLVFNEMFIKLSKLHETFSALKIFGCAPEILVAVP